MKGGLCDCSEIFEIGHNVPNILYYVVVLKYYILERPMNNINMFLSYNRYDIMVLRQK